MDAGIADPIEHEESDEDFGFFNVILYPKSTGLPMTVWIGPKRGARHDVRVKVGQTHGARVDIGDLAVMAVRPEPALLHGKLSSSDRALVARWIRLNEAAIVDHWDGVTDGADLIAALRPLEP